ncbi:unnamed protein product, partial [Didymodactylos carnosus]
MSKIFKSLLHKRDSPSTNVANNATNNNTNIQSATPQDILLTLTHLRKVFYEFSHPRVNWTVQDKNDRLYSTLPMLIKVLSLLGNNEWEEKFPEISDFTLAAAKLIVSEIRIRADKEPGTGIDCLIHIEKDFKYSRTPFLCVAAASVAIVQYLEMGDTQEDSMNGWTLFRSLKLLSTGPNVLLEKFAQATLPSTLVKCLYLFFDLPEISTTNDQRSDISAKEKRILLQQVFFQ